MVAQVLVHQSGLLIVGCEDRLFQIHCSHALQAPLLEAGRDATTEALVSKLLNMTYTFMPTFRAVSAPVMSVAVLAMAEAKDSSKVRPASTPATSMAHTASAALHT